MENFKGTQGIWRAVEYHKHDFIGLKVVSRPHLGDEEIIYDSGLGGYISFEDEANAKLIATAPEMLEMLIKISDNIDKNRGVNYMVELMGREYFDKIQNLIKKATE